MRWGGGGLWVESEPTKANCDRLRTVDATHHHQQGKLHSLYYVNKGDAMRSGKIDMEACTR